MALDPPDKDLIRHLAKREGMTMTRFILRLVSQEAARVAALASSPSSPT
jgi:uncharacterized protein (DUF1778 family)